MPSFRFIGDKAVIYSGDSVIELRRFGQIVSLTDEQAAACHANNIPILTESEFQEHGFTDSELRQFPSAAAHEEAPADFQAKKQALLIAHYELTKQNEVA
jgi:hypothetical protein